MGLFDRGRRDDASTGTHYRMREKLFAIGDDFWIEDEHGNRAFRVDGKALRVRDTLIFEDAAGRQLARIQERKLRIRDTMIIEDADGRPLASVKKAMIAPLRDRFVVNIADGPDLSVKGKILDHEYRIELDGHTIAEVSKKWFRITDSYGVEVKEGQNPVVILAVVTVIDQMSHDVA